MNSYDKEANFRQLANAASGRWREIIQTLSRVDVSDALSSHDRSKSRHVQCPMGHDDNYRRFRFFSDFDASGGGICSRCGTFPSGFKLLAWLNGWEFRTVVKEVANHLEGRGVSTKTMTEPPKPRERTFSVSKRKLKKLEKLWSGAEELAGTIGEKYLRNRGITCSLPASSDVRFHPSMEYWDSDTNRSLGDFPGIVGLVKTPQNGGPITIHRTFLSVDGKKADVESPKKLMPSAVDGAISGLGGAIQLFPAAGPVLGVCEGIETALSIRSALPDHPVWACISAPVLTKFRPPKGVRTVVIWADLDPGGAGQTAAAKLAVQLEESGIEAIIRIPGDGQIFVNDEDHYWANREFPIERLIERLETSGYRVSDRKSMSLDWADVWTDSPSELVEAA